MRGCDLHEASRFVLAPGHEIGEIGEIETVVELDSGCTVVEKVGHAAEVAAALDPRTA